MFLFYSAIFAVKLNFWNWFLGNLLIYPFLGLVLAGFGGWVVKLLIYPFVKLTLLLVHVKNSLKEKEKKTIILVIESCFYVIFWLILK